MRALGEDPARFAALKRELATAYGPGDPLWIRQIDDLARFYWRRERLERMETGLMRPKPPKQSQNVVENKGPAAKEISV